MKNLLIALGYFTTLFTALYAVFKFVRIPGAYIMMFIAGILIAIYFPLLFLNRYRVRYAKKPHLVHRFGAILLSVFILSVVFQLQHWSIIMYQGGQMIQLLSIFPWIFNSAYYCFSFLFIPLLLYVDYKEDQHNLLKNMAAGLGLAMISISLIGFQMHFAYHNELFITGNILFVVIYLPWYILTSLKKEQKEFHPTFQTLIIGYILTLFVYGVFLKWPVTYQDVLMNAK